MYFVRYVFATLDEALQLLYVVGFPLFGSRTFIIVTISRVTKKRLAMETVAILGRFVVFAYKIVGEVVPSLPQFVALLDQEGKGRVITLAQSEPTRVLNHIYSCFRAYDGIISRSRCQGVGIP